MTAAKLLGGLVVLTVLVVGVRAWTGMEKKAARAADAGGSEAQERTGPRDEAGEPRSFESNDERMDVLMLGEDATFPIQGYGTADGQIVVNTQTDFGGKTIGGELESIGLPTGGADEGAVSMQEEALDLAGGRAMGERDKYQVKTARFDRQVLGWAAAPDWSVEETSSVADLVLLAAGETSNPLVGAKPDSRVLFLGDTVDPDAPNAAGALLNVEQVTDRSWRGLAPGRQFRAFVDHVERVGGLETAESPESLVFGDVIVTVVETRGGDVEVTRQERGRVGVSRADGKPHTKPFSGEDEELQVLVDWLLEQKAEGDDE